jgi:anti-anti-sigma factor
MSDNPSNVVIDEIPQMPEACLIRLSGELDSNSVPAIDDSFRRCTDDTKKHGIAEMSGVTLVTSGALGTLLGIKRRFIERGGDLVLAGMNLELKMKLALMGANKIFTIYGDLRSAMNAYAWEVKHEAEHIQLSFPANLGIVPPVRAFVRKVIQHKGYSDRDSFRIETIVDEICNNAVQYGESDNKENIVLKLKVSWDKVEIDTENVSDPAKTDSLRKHMSNLRKKMSAESTDKRGRGLALVKMLASELTADVTEKGTTVHVTKFKEE